MPVQIKMRVNGEDREAIVSPEITVLDLLRNTWGLTGVKKGCDEGDCGACTVLLDGKAVNACLVLAIRADGHDVMTVEGLGKGEDPHPLQSHFVEHASLQCGFCGPGMLMSSKALLDENPNPSEMDIRIALSGNLCRCTGYTKIVSAVQSMAKKEKPSNSNKTRSAK